MTQSPEKMIQSAYLKIRDRTDYSKKKRRILSDRCFSVSSKDQSHTA